MKLEVHLLTNDADWILPWALRHYGSYDAKVIVHDGGPSWSETGPTRELCRAHGAEWRKWDTGREFNDDLNRRLKNDCWKGTDADWVVVADCDEFIYFPMGWESTLSAYDKTGAAVIRPYGFEMFSEAMPTQGARQIYDEIKNGAEDDKWYAKPILFNPRLLIESGFGIGAHESRPVLRDGRALLVNKNWPKPKPLTLLLHFHQIGTLDQVGNRYDATRKRLAQINVANNWGNFKPGREHAQEKRAYILPRLRQVVA